MFTFKKLACVGAAGLAAFAMSCSDDKDEDTTTPPGGSWDTTAPLAIVDGSTVNLNGKITINAGDEISKVTATANGKDVTVNLPPNALTTGVLDGTTLGGQCGAGVTAVFGPQSFDYVITVTFKTGGPLSGAVTKEINCGFPPGGWSFTLSSGTGTTDYSYADLDAEIQYMQTDATGSHILEIDLVSLYSASADNKIYTPYGVNLFYEGNSFSASGFKGGDVVIWKVPASLQATAASAILAASNVTDLTSFMGQASQIITAANHLGPSAGLDIENNVPFVVESTEGDLFAALIVASKLSGTKTVTLKTVPVGYIYYDDTFTICPNPLEDCSE